MDAYVMGRLLFLLFLFLFVVFFFYDKGIRIKTAATDNAIFTRMDLSYSYNVLYSFKRWGGRGCLWWDTIYIQIFIFEPKHLKLDLRKSFNLYLRSTDVCSAAVTSRRCLLLEDAET